MLHTGDWISDGTQESDYFCFVMISVMIKVFEESHRGTLKFKRKCFIWAFKIIWSCNRVRIVGSIKETSSHRMIIKLDTWRFFVFYFCICFVPERLLKKN